MSKSKEHKNHSLTWDAFISHASEDKRIFVKKLTDYLTSIGIKVWYDEFTLKVGDSLSHSIDNGLVNSNYGIVVISKSFLRKGWTDYEYRSLLSREIGFKKVLLPIWLDITKKEVQKYSPYLADKFALSANGKTVKQVGFKLVEIIRPDIYENFYRHLRYQELVRESKSKVTNLTDLKPASPKHKVLHKSYINRIKSFHYSLDKYFNFTLDQTINHFKCDTNPNYEIEIWEIINATFLDFVSKYKVRDEKLRRDIARQLLSLSVGFIDKETKLTKAQLTKLLKMWRDNYYPDRQFSILR